MICRDKIYYFEVTNIEFLKYIKNKWTNLQKLNSSDIAKFINKVNKLPEKNTQLPLHQLF